jgi:branched-chain amino acid transport system permease protein
VEILLQQVVNGLSIAAVIALMAMGVTLIFGLTGLVMFAHGELLMIGGFMTWWAFDDFGGSFWLGLVVAILVVSALGFLLERGLFRFTYDSPINGFIISLGLIIVFQHVIVELSPVGAGIVDVPRPIPEVFDIGGVRIPGTRVLVVSVTLAIVAVMMFVIYGSGRGRALRASAIDRETAALMGIPVRRYITVVFIVGSALAGLGGALMIGLFPIDPFIGGRFVIKAFAVALVGGLGNPLGAVLAAVFLGLSEAMGTQYFKPEWSESYAFVLMIIILLVRPQGLLTGLQGPPAR